MVWWNFTKIKNTSNGTKDINLLSCADHMGFTFEWRSDTMKCSKMAHYLMKNEAFTMYVGKDGESLK